MADAVAILVNVVGSLKSIDLVAFLLVLAADVAAFSLSSLQRCDPVDCRNNTLCFRMWLPSVHFLQFE